MNRNRLTDLVTVALLIVLGVTARLAFQVFPNFAPVAAIALFAGYLIRNRVLAVAAPLGVMVVSDWFIGGYHPAIMAVVYGSLAAPVLAGHWLRGHMNLSAGRTLGTLVGSSLAASCFFFLSTNLACWWFMPGYAHTLAGLAECYAFALPFFRYTLTGDLIFALGLFGGYFALESIWQGSPKSESALAK